MIEPREAAIQRATVHKALGILTLETLPSLPPGVRRSVAAAVMLRGLQRQAAAAGIPLNMRALLRAREEAPDSWS